MRNFHDTSETRKHSFISAFLIYMTVPLRISSVNVGSEKIEQASREEIANVLKILWYD